MIFTMRILKTMALICGVCAVSLSLPSCLNDDDYSLDKAELGIVTVKPTSDDAYYLQLDDNTTLWPVNITKPAVSKEHRALVYFTRLSDSIPGYSHAVKLLRMDSVLTKTIAPNLGVENDSIYGADPVRMHENSVWSKGGVWIEDGYLNINFITYFGGNKKHYLNLIPKTDSSNPYALEFRHHAFDDPKTTEQEGLVAFRLNDLPSTDGETVKLQLTYLSYEGEKTIELDYKTRED